MTETSPALADPPDGYAEWLYELKRRVYSAQQRAALAVNTEMLELYWHIGNEILERQNAQGWGRKVTERLSHDLRVAFPDLKGFSRTNLDYMRAFAQAWPVEAISQQAVGRLPWGHNLVLLSKLKETDDRVRYADAASRFGWSRSVLTIQIERSVLERQGQAVSNFAKTLTKPESDLAIESLKDPYKLEFLGLGEEAREHAVEGALIEHVTEFLLELGAGFAFVGRQVHVQVGEEDFYLDLLFYQLKLHRYVVIELKAEKFKPEHLGQLGFYMTAVDRQIRDLASDGKTLGLLLCKSKDHVVAEYALEDNAKALGIAEYRLTESLPEPLQMALPSIQQIERELGSKAIARGQESAAEPSAAPADVLDALRDPQQALTPAELGAKQEPSLMSAGMYSWWVDAAGAADLSSGLGHTIQPGIIYAGLAGATRRRSQQRSTNTLHGRLIGMHLGRRHRFSTFRYSLGSILANSWGESTIDEARLTQWMHAHLRVVAVPVDDPDTLEDVEDHVLAELDPPLNLRKVPRTQQRVALSELRRRHPRR